MIIHSSVLLFKQFFKMKHPTYKSGLFSHLSPSFALLTVNRFTQIKTVLHKKRRFVEYRVLCLYLFKQNITMIYVEEIGASPFPPTNTKKKSS